MTYEVTSWFVDQISARQIAPKLVFTIGTSDYSSRVRKWPTIKRTWDEVRAQSINLDLINGDRALNAIHDDKTQLAATCAIKFGFTHPTSGDELLTLFSGSMDKVRYSRGVCTLSLLDKFKQLSQRVMGTRDAPATFTNSSLPSDIAWSAITSYGGYSAVTSTNNPDINYQSFLDWAAVFSADNVFMNAQIEGLKCNEVLKKIARHTQSAIFVENDRFTFHRFTAADSNQTTLDDDTILDIVVEIDDEDIVNRQYVYGAYNVTSRDWGVQVYDELTSSVNTYGLREQVEKDKAIWYVNSVAALNMAQRITAISGEPYDRITVDAAPPAALRQVGETLSISDPFFEGTINGNYRVMGYDFNLDSGVFSARVDRSQYASPFILDFSALDSSDVLL